VLLGVAEPGSPEQREDARRRLLAGEVRFPELARERGWRFQADALAYVARWITPPFAPVRFETSYFVARVPETQHPVVIPGELAEGEWVRPVAALKRWQLGHETFVAPILHTLIGLAQGGAEGLAARLAGAPEAAGGPVRRIEPKWGVVLQPMRTRPLPPATHTNAYLVGESEMALIDPGSDDPDELRALFELIEMLEHDRRRLKLVVLTHHHPDHVAGVNAVRERYGVPVAAHAETARHVRADFTLADGDWIPLAPGVGDWSLRALHTPGHTRGHLCFLHPRTRSLFTGDHITGGTGTVIIDPPEGDMAAYIASLERLLGQRVEILFPAHGSPQGAAERRIRGLVAHRLEREARVRDALGETPRTVAELVPGAYADTPRDLWSYAERSLLAHLLKLEAEGQAGREGERWRRPGEGSS
jgi:glyoxylase-like metal-dependent hydrolase (beta-lactamase superfamily II)